VVIEAFCFLRTSYVVRVLSQLKQHCEKLSIPLITSVGMGVERNDSKSMNTGLIIAERKEVEMLNNATWHMISCFTPREQSSRKVYTVPYD
jgi:hypothetical protein